MKNLLITISAIASLFVACDSGDILPEEEVVEQTRSVNISLTLKNTATIPVPRVGTDTYERRLVFLLYDSEGDIAVSHIIKQGDVEENVKATIAIDNVPYEVSKAKLVIATKKNDPIYEVKNFDVADSETDLDIDLGSALDLLSYKRVQEQVFTWSCLNCHNSSNSSAGLNLEKNVSFVNIKDVVSQKEPTMKIVASGDLDNSILYHFLTEDNYKGHMNHTNFSTLDANDVTVVKEWIKSGANSN